MTTPQMIFVNLPVKDLEVTKNFFAALGFGFNPQFSDETTACLVISDTIFAMLISEPRFKDFTKKEIADAEKTTEVLVALSAESRARVDELADAALASGGSPANDPMDMGFMYGRSFQDPDHHIWEVVWMDPQAAADGPQA
ncbi:MULTISPECIES: VOC family protein [unclassified Streptomyces]|uniref:VOC family protein n=1 Tax=Streptomyces TaxID=1883 RepID=UPI0001C18EB2|nr:MULTISPECIES: VOC family protein [unclassified Streptomyces]AEN09837.1 Glyoxalase/bleomycin resistance protein/dioxygenase [Streptomyces sp. SirexAA-E]MYR64797.1 glyoxalase [Streptomyces sp. SID4939]MYS01555.1 glyoxalase [Streptomyces sp. SID4940]MYT64305.1 glyoxalase [Streptomyces sp. SID8357]MYT87118.1 glyoxalase [Streptomyces sp. SID8360]